MTPIKKSIEATNISKTLDERFIEAPKISTANDEKEDKGKEEQGRNDTNLKDMSVKYFIISPTSEMIKDTTLDDIECNDEGKEGEMADNDEDEEPF